MRCLGRSATVVEQHGGTVTVVTVDDQHGQKDPTAERFLRCPAKLMGWWVSTGTDPNVVGKIGMTTAKRFPRAKNLLREYSSHSCD